MSEKQQIPAESLMAWLDGELPEEEAAAFEELLGKHPEWREEVASMSAIVQATSRLQLPPPPARTWDHYWEEIDDRISKRFGWGLLFTGSMILISIGVWKVLHHTEDMWVKSGLVLVVLGVIALFAGVLRARIRELPHDRYRRIRK
ncbi:MAG: hypothetical protein JJU11_13995 [Candidatus Sumerlaeia bacterium]|nr:hypothetical protein [Candidatus Sumerlaeia bacterium]